MLDYSKNNLLWLIDLLQDLPEGVYDSPSRFLSQATIGQHLRHIAEMYQSLISGYDSGTIEYDKRNRDHRIETDRAFAESTLTEIINNIDRADKPLTVICELEGREVKLESNYHREILYNMEHAIHHMALIKVAVIEMTDIILPKEFGVAPTTLQYRAQCVQ
jgi:hypothetical protein